MCPPVCLSVLFPVVHARRLPAAPGALSRAGQRRLPTQEYGDRRVVVVGDLYVGKTSLIHSLSPHGVPAGSSVARGLSLRPVSMAVTAWSSLRAGSDGFLGPHRFCKNVFDRDYKATIGVDFEMERFEVAGIPFSLQIWDTAGQEKFKCIASAYYRGAQVIITAFDLTDMQTLEHTRQWLEDALRENEPGACFLFLVGTKKDLLSGAACEQAEAEAVRLANEMQAEYWSVSAKTGENVKAFFSRVAALAFERSVLQDLERRSSARPQVGDGDIIRTCRDGGTSTRDPGQQEALQPRLLLAEPASEASTACMRVGSASRDLEGDMEHPPC
ncbi:ras-related protein Rab-36 isoform X3 [Lagenorhynchus albirostris]|uniref:ras-related protein Rab-36 isoform X3 n=1 Tax=Lagenorhynchus albirostris TaxID=27610 RepID=UPI0028E37866|nr:ras-related protein Rab-36 isoform X3 [Lagenorhynchus albirostris]